MEIIKKISLDLNFRDEMPQVDAMQNDADTRGVEIALKSGREPWTVPEDVSVAVGYSKPDGTKGLYDTLPDGSCAVTVSGDRVTVILARQMLTIHKGMLT